MKDMENELIKKLRVRLLEIAQLEAALGLLGWDEQVMMPRKATPFRAQTNAYLAGLHHEKLLELNKNSLLDKLNSSYSLLSVDEKILVRETLQDFNKVKNIPTSLTKKISQLSTEGYTVWMKARENNDSTIFEPILERLVDLKIEEANYIGFKKSPYDALLDQFEPGMTVDELTNIFERLKKFLVPFIKKTRLSKTKIKPLLGDFDLNSQRNFCRILTEKIGFDFESGRLDTSTHPFTSGNNPRDVRITTRYDRNDLTQSIMSTIHETGHALYEQGLPEKYFGTPLGQSLSFGIHESQSMFWEKRIGTSLAFWKFFYPELKNHFVNPLSNLPLDQFYKSINIVTPSLIRTDADEATYCLHIILRFELERDLIEQKIRVKDLKKLWNKKMESYLGVEVPDDVKGILQDVHWSGGSFGYFPSYALGNLYSAQFYAAAKKAIVNFDQLVSEGNFTQIHSWLQKNIFSMGRRYNPKKLTKKITGQELNPQFFFDYLEDKYKDIYEY